MLLSNRFSFTLVLLAFAAPLYAQGLGLGTPEAPVTDWPTADPAALGLDTLALAEHAALCEASGATACLVAYKGHIVQEWTAPDRRHFFFGTASATKSIAAVLTGMLIGDGKIGGVDDPVARYLPEWQAGADSAVTIRHLLTMTSGLAASFSPEMGPGVVAAADPEAFVFGLPLTYAPGERWGYSNESPQLLAPILERVAGMPLAAYARERLFDPLGMRRTMLRVGEYYHTWLAGGAETTPHDFARLGQLVLNGGRWNGEQIVPEDWIAALNTPTPQNPSYGYLWWRLRDGAALAAAGDLDRILAVLPEQELVAVRLQEGVLPQDPDRPTYFNDRGRMHGAAVDILQRVVASTPTGPH